MTVEERLTQLEKQQSAQTEAIARLVQGKWTGADGAAGKVVELMGGTPPAGFTPVPFDPAEQ